MSAAIVLKGDARQRGRGQAEAAPDAIGVVRAMVAERLSANRDLMADPRYRDYLGRTAAFLAEHDADGDEELCGIAEGFGLDRADLFAFLHMAVVREISQSEGCSAFAFTDPRHGAVVGKNRDLGGSRQLPLQRVFHHADPAWGGRRCLFVGSLGAPGAYSSGINSDGLALADTQIATRDHGVGLLRYFLMTRLLTRCVSVAEALAEVDRVVHAGGGSIVMADRSGAVAAVELGHSRHAIEHRAAGSVVQTNHFVDRSMAAANFDPDKGGPDGSADRLSRLGTWLADAVAPTLAAARAELASHDAPERVGLCRHGGDSAPNTVSGALFTTAVPTLYFCHGSPCRAEWRQYGAV